MEAFLLLQYGYEESENQKTVNSIIAATGNENFFIKQQGMCKASLNSNCDKQILREENFRLLESGL